MKLTPLVALVAITVTAQAAPGPKKVAIVLYEGAEILDFAGPTEVFVAAGHHSHGALPLEVYTVARSTAPITSQGIVKITPQYSIDNAPRPDFVVIPGGGSEALSNDPAMMKWLLGATAASEVTLTVCTGAFPLAKAGVFDGMEITTFHGAIESLRKQAPKARVTDGRRFIDNGRYVTTAGVSAGIDGALHVVARVLGRRVADDTARYMEYHWSPEPYLAKRYAYWNPSTDDRGRALQAAQAAAEDGRVTDAIAAYRKLAETDRDGVAWTALGDLLFQQHDRRGALAAYQRVRAGSPVYAKALYNTACTHALLGDRKAALAFVEKALAAGMKREFALGDPDLASIKAEIEKLR